MTGDTGLPGLLDQLLERQPHDLARVPAVDIDLDGAHVVTSAIWSSRYCSMCSNVAS